MLLNKIDYENCFNEIVFNLYDDHKSFCPICCDSRAVIYFSGSFGSGNPDVLLNYRCCCLHIKHLISNEVLKKYINKRFYLGLDLKEKDTFLNLLDNEIVSFKIKIIKTCEVILGDRFCLYDEYRI